MLLVADIGNTSTTFGIYDGEQLVDRWCLSSDKNRSEDDYGMFFKNILDQKGFTDKLTAAVISSVVLPLTDRYKNAIEKYIKIPVLNVSTKINLGIKFDIDNPKEAGPDRVANVCAANALYKPPAVILDFGTATTFDIISNEGVFIGGIIAPGMGISAEALNTFTSRLPKIKLEPVDTVLGKNTIDNMLIGIIRGQAAMIDGLIIEIQEELGYPVKTIATGGLSSLVANYLRRPFDFINQNLTIEGLRLIYELNKELISKL